MNSFKPIYLGALTLTFSLLIPTLALAGHVKVVGSVSVHDSATEFLILDHEGGSAEVSCGTFATGRTFQIQITPLRQDEFDRGAVVHVARSFQSKRECLAYKAKLFTASPSHPITLPVAEAALTNST